MRTLALAKRAAYEIDTSSLSLAIVRKIYKAEGVKIDQWEIKGRKLKAAYFCDDTDCSVLINKKLPKEPKLFALIHELKHHYVDQAAIKDGKIQCGDYNANELIEKGAEVFAAEFIYPEDEMRQFAGKQGIHKGACSAEQIVNFKRSCPSTISYKFILKRFEWFEFIERNEHGKVHFLKLEENIYGLPIYKQEWFKQARASRKTRQGS